MSDNPYWPFRSEDDMKKSGARLSVVQPTGRTGTADGITLCAISTGALYKKHCALAREKASDEKWLVHTLLHVLPSYRMDTRTTEHFDAETVKMVAVDLKDYYTQHIAEG